MNRSTACLRLDRRASFASFYPARWKATHQKSTRSPFPTQPNFSSPRCASVPRRLNMTSADSNPLPSRTEQEYMELALQQAEQCIPTPTAFCVGAVIVSSSTSSSLDKLSSSSSASPSSKILSTGYSRELPGNTHAEQCAIDKLVQERGEEEARILLRGADIYTTMEPCSIRLSGNLPCTNRIIEYGFGRVFLGTKEPDEFVECEGVRLLKDEGIKVITVEGFAERALEIARRGH